MKHKLYRNKVLNAFFFRQMTRTAPIFVF